MPRVTTSNARQHLQSAIDLFTKVTGEAVGTTFIWNGQMNIIGSQSFKEFVEKHHKEMWHSLISSVHKPEKQSVQSNDPATKAEYDCEMLEMLSTQGYPKQNIYTLRRLVGWLMQRTLGMFYQIY